MRRNVVLLSTLLALIAALLAGLIWVTVPGPLARLLPAGAVATRVGQVSGGRLRIVARLDENQSHYAVYDHLSARGWTLRQFSGPRQDHDLVYTRSSLGGYLLETAMLVQVDDARRSVTILYQVCVRGLSCGLR
jgi:hypothetical protein